MIATVLHKGKKLPATADEIKRVITAVKNLETLEKPVADTPEELEGWMVIFGASEPCDCACHMPGFAPIPGCCDCGYAGEKR